MKLTVNQLRRIIKEEVQKVMQGSSPVTVEVDYGEFPGDPKMGDVTNVVVRQQRSYGIPAEGLIKAVVVDEMGPAGGNPIVHLTFDSMDNAAAWWEASGYGDMDDIENAIV